jgi:hypothetical protein
VGVLFCADNEWNLRSIYVLVAKIVKSELSYKTGATLTFGNGKTDEI